MAEGSDELYDLLCHHHGLYRLTSLQIGDMKSYVSRLFLHITYDGTKLIFLVDNDPWSLKNWRSKPAELWQLMVTQSRASPFANHRVKTVQEESGCLKEKLTVRDDPTDKFAESDIFSTETCRMIFQDEHCIYKPFQNVVQKHLKSLMRANELSNLLHGCVTFEVAWESVKGINYVNELQTDTCVALEAKALTKRDFDSLQQALSFYEGICSQAKQKEFSPSKRKSNGSFWDSSCSASSTTNEQRGSRDCMKLRGNFLDDGLKEEDVAMCMASSSSVFDSPGNCGMNKQGTCSTDFYSCFRDHGLNDSFSPETSNIALRSDNCFYFDALDCFCNTAEQPSVDGAFHCNYTNVLENDFEESAVSKQSAGNGLNSYFSKIVPCVSCEEYDIPVTKIHLLGEFHKEHSSSFCCKDHEQSDMETQDSNVHNAFVSNVYKDALVLFWFCDPILPFKLKNIITVDQRLLKLLESGLPSWVMFLQSYPIFCSIYKPWMWPLARTIYVLASIITVIIGFYDLYKNVPILKSTAARLCGPLFDWIEAWEMVSRLKYLGTMLFLQNCEKAFKWLLTIVRTLKHLALLLMKPMIDPFRDFGVYVSPIWNVVVEGVLEFGVDFWMAFSSMMVYINNILQSIIWPIFVLLTAIWKLVMLLLYPVFSSIWAVVIFPLQMILGLVNLMVITICGMLNFFETLWQLISYSIQIIYASGHPVAKSLSGDNPSSTQLSPLWRTLPSDLLSKVFRATRSIVNGFVAFFTACNRHRLSIYNHLSASLVQMVDFVKSARSLVSSTYQRIHKLPMPSDDTIQEYTDDEVKRARENG